MYHLLEEIVVSEEIVSSILIFRIKNTSPFLTYYYYYYLLKNLNFTEILFMVLLFNVASKAIAS